MLNRLIDFWKLPETKDVDLDSPNTLPLHRQIIHQKPFLRKLYELYYAIFQDQAHVVQPLRGQMLEIGSGGGFLKKVIPDVLTSDLHRLPEIDREVSAEALPFKNEELKAIFMLFVLHHLPDPQQFFSEADRCLVRGGRVVMIEPTNSFWGRIVYKHFHHEPFDETVTQWSSPVRGRLTTSNQALPWIIFSRDRAQFEASFPRLKIVDVQPHTTLMYVLSGGLSWRSFAPGWSFRWILTLDKLLSSLDSVFPTCQTIILEKK